MNKLTNQSINLSINQWTCDSCSWEQLQTAYDWRRRSPRFSSWTSWEKRFC